MDQTTTGLLQAEPEEVTAREEAARPDGKSAVANLVDRVDRKLNLSLDEKQRNVMMQVVHYGLGAGPGALYAVLRRRLPAVAAGHGLAYGVLLWGVNDEYINSAPGLAAPFGA